MSSLSEFIPGDDHSVAAWLTGISFKVAIILAVAAIAGRLLRAQSASVRHRVWAMSLTASLLMPLVAAVMPSFEVAFLPGISVLDRDSSHTADASGVDAVFAPPESPTASPKSFELTSRNTYPNTTPPETPAASASPSVGPMPQPRPISTAQELFIPDRRSILLGVRIGGSCLLGVWFLLALCLQFRRHRRLEPIVDDDWLAAVAAQSRRLGLKRSVRTFESSRGMVPAVFGLIRPYLIVPHDWRAWSDEQRTCILLHELAHIKRRDVATQFVGRLAVAMDWFNPLAWYAARQLRLERELACDDCVLMAGQRASDYAQQLLQILKMYRTDRVTLGVAMAHSARLDQRILAILDHTRCRLPMSTRAVLVSLLFALAFTAGLGAVAFSSRAADAQSTALPTIQNAKDPDSAALFNGRVLDPDGEPFAGAEILIVPMNPGPEYQETATVRATTGADGRFQFEARDMTVVDLDGFLTRRRCTVIARADGYGPDWGVVRGGRRIHGIQSFVRSIIRGTELSLQLVKDDVPIRGRLLDVDGQPLADARVGLRELLIPGQGNLDAQLKREAHVRANPYSGSLGYERGLIGATLQAVGIAEVRTDSDGRFTMTGFGNERLARLSVSAKPVIDTQLTAVTRDMPDLTFQPDPNDPDRDMSREVTGAIRGANFTVRLPRGLTVNGQVIDRDTREPIAGMRIGTRRDRVNDLVNGDAHSNVSDADGRFTITGLDPRILTYKAEHRQITAVSPPGQPYGTASGTIDAESKVFIECARGIPYRLKVVDETGTSVDAIVSSVMVSPNDVVNRNRFRLRDTISRAARTADGIYEGFVLPGPGAILVKTPPSAGYRPAHVDPKGTFAPGRTTWTAQEKISTYGNHDTVMGAGIWHSQHDYSAIVLTNAEPGSSPLELTATVYRDRPRQLTIVDPQGKPVVGVTTRGLSFHPWDTEPPLRSASIPLTGLHPDRPRRILFFHENRQLIGFLMARGDDDSPHTVRMQPWGTVTGRLVDASGKSFVRTSLTSGSSGTVINPDATVGDNVGTKTDADGRFRIDRLVPGLKYTVRAYRGIGRLVGPAFENLVVRPGEVRDLGDINPAQGRAEL